MVLELHVNIDRIDYPAILLLESINKMGKIKILYVLTKKDAGGAEKYVIDLTQNLNQNKFETKIIRGNREIKWLSNDTRPHLFFLNDWLAMMELAKIYRSEKPHIVHLNNSKAGVLGSLARLLAKILHPTGPTPKIVFTAHGWVFNPQNKLGWIAKLLYPGLHRITAFFQDRIINVSNYDRALALQHKIANPRKLVTVYNGISPKIKFLNKEEARTEILNRIRNWESGIKNSQWVGSIGRLVKEKNFSALVEAASRIPHSNFFLIGSGQEEKGLHRLIDRLGLNQRFFILPGGNDDFKYLRAFDVFAISSIKEGLPYTLLEAMAAKIPIVATDTGGIPEIIDRPVKTSDPVQLSGAIKEMLENKKLASEQIRLNSKKLTRFSLKKMVEETERIYLELTGAPE